MAQPNGYSSRKRRYRHQQQPAGTKPAEKRLPKIFFCGDPHGQFDQINWAATQFKPDAVVILGDLQPAAPIEEVLGPALAVTQVWWIPGNHDTDTEEIYDRLWKGPIAAHNLNGRVVNIAGVSIAGLGGVFRGQIWMPDGPVNYQSPAEFLQNASRVNTWRGGLPRRHRSSIFPSVYQALMRQRADILVTHEAAGCHKKGFEAIDRLARAMKAKRIFHGHQHEDVTFAPYKGLRVRAVGFRGVVDIEGNVIVEAQIDPRDLLVMQQAGMEPSPEVFDTIDRMPIVDIFASHPVRRGEKGPFRDRRRDEPRKDGRPRQPRRSKDRK